MLLAERKASQKRIALKKALGSNGILRFPGAYSPLVAMLIQEKGFDGVYISGAVTANDLGLPDIGLTGASELAHRGGQIAGSCDLPAIGDMDTGFGSPLNGARTVRLLEEAGLAGAHIEDQRMPKRCGHLDNKELIDAHEMIQKIKACAKALKDSDFLLIARTDARTVEGLDKAIERAKAYVDAGAQMIFPEALKDESEFEAFRKALPKIFLLANMTEFGKSEILSADRLENLGYDMVIYPVTTMRLAMKAVEDGLDHLKTVGDQKGIISRMQERSRLYELLRYKDYAHFDQGIANFDSSKKERG
ncbi:MAG: methylisocitrate lyase [Bacteriovoracales bacterium]|nr:methylisocitrate lyase [Bacteriovoracales bacterium]